jgi:hypothetical protein
MCRSRWLPAGWRGALQQLGMQLDPMLPGMLTGMLCPLLGLLGPSPVLDCSDPSLPQSRRPPPAPYFIITTFVLTALSHQVSRVKEAATALSFPRSSSWAAGQSVKHANPVHPASRPSILEAYGWGEVPSFVPIWGVMCKHRPCCQPHMVDDNFCAACRCLAVDTIRGGRRQPSMPRSSWTAGWRMCCDFIVVVVPSS